MTNTELSMEELAIKIDNFCPEIAHFLSNYFLISSLWHSIIPDKELLFLFVPLLIIQDISF